MRLFSLAVAAVLASHLLSSCTGADELSIREFPREPEVTKVRLFLHQSVARGSLTGKRRRSVLLTAKSVTPLPDAIWKGTLRCSSLELKILDEQENGCQIAVVEVGNEYADDDYNRQLVKSGPKEVVRLRLIYEPAKGRMELSEVSRVGD